MYTTFSLSMPLLMDTDYFHVVVIVNKATVNIRIQDSDFVSFR